MVHKVRKLPKHPLAALCFLSDLRQHTVELKQRWHVYWSVPLIHLENPKPIFPSISLLLLFAIQTISANMASKIFVQSIQASTYGEKKLGGSHSRTWPC